MVIVRMCTRCILHCVINQSSLSGGFFMGLEQLSDGSKLEEPVLSLDPVVSNFLSEATGLDLKSMGFCCRFPKQGNGQGISLVDISGTVFFDIDSSTGGINRVRYFNGGENQMCVKQVKHVLEYYEGSGREVGGVTGVFWYLFGKIMASITG